MADGVIHIIHANTLNSQLFFFRTTNWVILCYVFAQAYLPKVSVSVSSLGSTHD